MTQSQIMVAFTLEYDKDRGKRFWTNKSSQTDKSSSVFHTPFRLLSYIHLKHIKRIGRNLQMVSTQMVSTQTNTFENKGTVVWKSGKPLIQFKLDSTSIRQAFDHSIAYDKIADLFDLTQQNYFYFGNRVRPAFTQDDLFVYIFKCEKGQRVIIIGFVIKLNYKHEKMTDHRSPLWGMFLGGLYGK